MNAITTDTQDALAQARMHTLAQRLAQATDEEQLRLHPLPKHAIAEEEEHLRRHYALVLAALLSAQAQVSESQSRLFMLLLDSMKLGEARAALFEEARALQPNALIEAARLIREEEWAEELLIDALVLLRLDSPLDEETAHLVGELTALLKLNVDVVEWRASHAAQILGLQAERGSEVLIECWPERIPYRITSKKLTDGLDGGLWYLDRDLTIHHSWSAKNAILFFKDACNLHTLMENGLVSIENCQIIYPLMNFLGAGELKIFNSKIHGKYNKRSIAIKNTGFRALISNSFFSTPGANAIWIENGDLALKECEFESCGGEVDYAGAITILKKINHNIENCEFKNCSGKTSGSIYTKFLKNLANCNFHNSQSLELKKCSNIGIFSVETLGDPAIENSNFFNSSVNLGNSVSGSSARKPFLYGLSSAADLMNTPSLLVKKSTFNNSNIYYYDKLEKTTIHKQCTFEQGKTVKFEFFEQ